MTKRKRDRSAAADRKTPSFTKKGPGRIHAGVPPALQGAPRLAGPGPMGLGQPGPVQIIRPVRAERRRRAAL